MHTNSIFARLSVPQDIVDQYLNRLLASLQSLCDRLDVPRWKPFEWPQGGTYALVLSHDIDFLPSGFIDTAIQGATSILRHLVRQRDPSDAAKAAAGLVWSLIQGRDPYGCVAQIIDRGEGTGSMRFVSGRCWSQAS